MPPIKYSFERRPEVRPKKVNIFYQQQKKIDDFLNELWREPEKKNPIFIVVIQFMLNKILLLQGLALFLNV